MSDGQDIVPLRLLKKVDSLFAGETTGRPRGEAIALIKDGKAERLDRPQSVTAAPDKPAADKAVEHAPKADAREQLAEMASPTARIEAADPDDWAGLKELARELGVADDINLSFRGDTLKQKMLDALDS